MFHLEFWLFNHMSSLPLQLFEITHIIETQEQETDSSDARFTLA